MPHSSPGCCGPGSSTFNRVRSQLHPSHPSHPCAHSLVTWLASEPPHVTPLHAHTEVHCAAVHSVQPNSRRAAFTSAQLVIRSRKPSKIRRSAGGGQGGAHGLQGGHAKDGAGGSCDAPQRSACSPAGALTAWPLRRWCLCCLGGCRRGSTAAERQCEKQQGCRQQGTPHAARMKGPAACEKDTASSEASFWRGERPGAWVSACTAPWRCQWRSDVMHESCKELDDGAGPRQLSRRTSGGRGAEGQEGARRDLLRAMKHNVIAGT